MSSDFDTTQEGLRGSGATLSGSMDATREMEAIHLDENGNLIEDLPERITLNNISGRNDPIVDPAEVEESRNFFVNLSRTGFEGTKRATNNWFTEFKNRGITGNVKQMFLANPLTNFIAQKSAQFDQRILKDEKFAGREAELRKTWGIFKALGQIAHGEERLQDLARLVQSTIMTGAQIGMFIPPAQPMSMAILASNAALRTLSGLYTIAFDKDVKTFGGLATGVAGIAMSAILESIPMVGGPAGKQILYGAAGAVSAGLIEDVLVASGQLSGINEATNELSKAKRQEILTKYITIFGAGMGAARWWDDILFNHVLDPLVDVGAIGSTIVDLVDGNNDQMADPAQSESAELAEAQTITRSSVPLSQLSGTAFDPNPNNNIPETIHIQSFPGLSPQTIMVDTSHGAPIYYYEMGGERFEIANFEYDGEVSGIVMNHDGVVSGVLADGILVNHAANIGGVLDHEVTQTLSTGHINNVPIQSNVDFANAPVKFHSEMNNIDASISAVPLQNNWMAISLPNHPGEIYYMHVSSSDQDLFYGTVYEADGDPVGFIGQNHFFTLDQGRDFHENMTLINQQGGGVVTSIEGETSDNIIASGDILTIHSGTLGTSELVKATVEGRDVDIFRIDGQYYARTLEADPTYYRINPSTLMIELEVSDTQLENDLDDFSSRYYDTNGGKNESSNPNPTTNPNLNPTPNTIDSERGNIPIVMGQDVENGQEGQIARNEIPQDLRSYANISGTSDVRAYRDASGEVYYYEEHLESGDYITSQAGLSINDNIHILYDENGHAVGLVRDNIYGTNNNYSQGYFANGNNPTGDTYSPPERFFSVAEGGQFVAGQTNQIEVATYAYGADFDAQTFNTWEVDVDINGDITEIRDNAGNIVFSGNFDVPAPANAIDDTLLNSDLFATPNLQNSAYNLGINDSSTITDVGDFADEVRDDPELVAQINSTYTTDEEQLIFERENDYLVAAVGAEMNSFILEDLREVADDYKVLIDLGILPESEISSFTAREYAQWMIVAREWGFFTDNATDDWLLWQANGHPGGTFAEFLEDGNQGGGLSFQHDEMGRGIFTTYIEYDPSNPGIANFWNAIQSLPNNRYKAALLEYWEDVISDRTITFQEAGRLVTMADLVGPISDPNSPFWPLAADEVYDAESAGEGGGQSPIDITPLVAAALLFGGIALLRGRRKREETEEEIVNPNPTGTPPPIEDNDDLDEINPDDDDFLDDELDFLDDEPIEGDDEEEVDLEAEEVNLDDVPIVVRPHGSEFNSNSIFGTGTDVLTEDDIRRIREAYNLPEGDLPLEFERLAQIYRQQEQIYDDSIEVISLGSNPVGVPIMGTVTSPPPVIVLPEDLTLFAGSLLNELRQIGSPATEFIDMFNNRSVSNPNELRDAINDYIYMMDEQSNTDATLANKWLVAKARLFGQYSERADTERLNLHLINEIDKIRNEVESFNGILAARDKVINRYDKAGLERLVRIVDSRVLEKWEMEDIVRNMHENRNSLDSSLIKILNPIGNIRKERQDLYKKLSEVEIESINDNGANRNQTTIITRIYNGANVDYIFSPDSNRWERVVKKNYVEVPAPDYIDPYYGISVLNNRINQRLHVETIVKGLAKRNGYAENIDSTVDLIIQSVGYNISPSYIDAILNNVAFNQDDMSLQEKIDLSIKDKKEMDVRIIMQIKQKIDANDPLFNWDSNLQGFIIPNADGVYRMSDNLVDWEYRQARGSDWIRLSGEDINMRLGMGSPAAPVPPPGEGGDEGGEDDEDIMEVEFENVEEEEPAHEEQQDSTIDAEAIRAQVIEGLDMDLEGEVSDITAYNYTDLNGNDVNITNFELAEHIANLNHTSLRILRRLFDGSTTNEMEFNRNTVIELLLQYPGMDYDFLLNSRDQIIQSQKVNAYQGGKINIESTRTRRMVSLIEVLTDIQNAAENFNKEEERQREEEDADEEGDKGENVVEVDTEDEIPQWLLPVTQIELSRMPGGLENLAIPEGLTRRVPVTFVPGEDIVIGNYIYGTQNRRIYYNPENQAFYLEGGGLVTSPEAFRNNPRGWFAQNTNLNPQELDELFPVVNEEEGGSDDRDKNTELELITPRQLQREKMKNNQILPGTLAAIELAQAQDEALVEKARREQEARNEEGRRILNQNPQSNWRSPRNYARDAERYNSLRNATEFTEDDLQFLREFNEPVDVDEAILDLRQEEARRLIELFATPEEPKDEELANAIRNVVHDLEAGITVSTADLQILLAARRDQLSKQKQDGVDMTATQSRNNPWRAPLGNASNDQLNELNLSQQQAAISILNLLNNPSLAIEGDEAVRLGSIRAKSQANITAEDLAFLNGLRDRLQNLDEGEPQEDYLNVENDPDLSTLLIEEREGVLRGEDARRFQRIYADVITTGTITDAQRSELLAIRNRPK